MIIIIIIIIIRSNVCSRLVGSVAVVSPGPRCELDIPRGPLDRLFGWAPSATTDKGVKEIDRLERYFEEKRKRGEKEAEEERKAENEGLVYVPNGSRDKHGYRRSNSGGRPRKTDVERSGVAGGASTNARIAGTRKQRSVPAPEKLDIIKLMEAKAMKFYASGKTGEAIKSYWRSVSNQWPSWNIRDLKNLPKLKTIFEKQIARLSLGRGFQGRTLGKPGRKRPDHSNATSNCNRGIRVIDPERKPGPRNKFHKFIMQVKIWHHFERMMNHHVDKEDCYLEFTEYTQREIDPYKILEKNVGLTASEFAWVEEMERRLAKLSKSETYRKTFKNKIAADIGAVEGTPSRYTALSGDEEQIRFELSVQQFDQRLWLAAFGTEEQLSMHVADAKKFMLHRKDIVLVFVDQIPFWVKVGKMRTLFASWGKNKKIRKGAPEVADAEGASDAPPSKRRRLDPKVAEMVGKVESAAKDLSMEGQTQTRGAMKSGQEKYRITFEARQAVLNYFDETKDPIGVILPSIVIVYGDQHACLSNIDDNNRWIKHEQFEVLNMSVEHIPGAYTKGALRGYVDLRKRRPELFKNLIIISQPSATQDDAVQNMCIGELMGRFPACIHQQDVLSAALTENAKVGRKLAHQIDSFVAPDMTPVCQLTDTDIAKPVKVFAEQAKQRLV